MKNPPNRPGHKIIVGGEPVVVTAVRRERGRDVYIGRNGVAWIVSQ